MRSTLRGRWLAVTLGALAAGGPRAARAEDAPAAPAPEVWEGYVWKDREGKLQFGEGVVAMGVMMTPPHYVGGPLAARLLPYAVGDDYWLFWNYMLERPEPKTLEGLPKVLVRLEGVVTEGANPDPHSFPSQAPRTMREARLATIEFLDPEWLRAWALFFREPVSPFRVAARPDVTPAQERAFAERALAALQRMRARPGPSQAQQAEARGLEPTTRVVTRFREEKEGEIHAWLARECNAKGWTLPGLEALPPLPPSSTEVQGWFLQSATKEAFLAKARQAWAGDPARLVLVHYVTRGNSTSYATADLEEVRDHWTEAQFQARQRDTRAMGAGR